MDFIPPNPVYSQAPECNPINRRTAFAGNSEVGAGVASHLQDVSHKKQLVDPGVKAPEFSLNSTVTLATLYIYRTRFWGYINVLLLYE